MGQLIETLGVAGQTVSDETIQFCYCRAKAATDSTKMNGCYCVPIKLYLGEQARQDSF